MARNPARSRTGPCDSLFALHNPVPQHFEEDATQLISLAAPVHVWTPGASLPVEAVALLGKVDEEGEVRRAEVHALVPPCGGLLTFRSPVILTLRGEAVAATQDIVLPADSMPSA